MFDLLILLITHIYNFEYSPLGNFICRNKELKYFAFIYFNTKFTRNPIQEYFMFYKLSLPYKR